jgi:hypothetical protein
MFKCRSELLRINPAELNYGVAVADVDGDGADELLVAGYGYPNKVLKWTGECFVDRTPAALADPERQAIGVAAGDLDGDGREEIYFLNTDTFAGRKRFGDRLFQRRGRTWIDLFEQPENAAVLNQTAGRSVVAIDRQGTGRYGFFIANYGGPPRLYELSGSLQDVAPRAGLARPAGGRGALALPLVSNHMDLFCVNEGGPNYFFRNEGNGAFTEVAADLGLADPGEHGRGVAVVDQPGLDAFALAWGNWEGLHRLMVRQPSGRYENQATPALALPSRVRTLLVADFDNDGYQEIFFNNFGEPNRLFGWRDEHWMPIATGDALEPAGLGTGAAYGDFDGDGRLELLISHGEAAPQPLSLFHGPANDHHWLRVLPMTTSGAPARGAIVTLRAGGRVQRRAIDAGSGYLCQMEPCAHFGLGAVRQVEAVSIRWPDGAIETIAAPTVDQAIRVKHPKRGQG